MEIKLTQGRLRILFIILPGTNQRCEQSTATWNRIKSSNCNNAFLKDFLLSLWALPIGLLVTFCGGLAQLSAIIHHQPPFCWHQPELMYLYLQQLYFQRNIMHQLYLCIFCIYLCIFCISQSMIHCYATAGNIAIPGQTGWSLFCFCLRQNLV